MNNQTLEILAQYAAFRLGCEKALALLTDPDSTEFDANKVITFLEYVLESK